MDFWNFATWKEHFEDALAVQELQDYIEANVAAPPKVKTAGSPNYDYLKWVRNNRLILGWMRATCMASVQKIFVTCQTAAEAWRSLEERILLDSRVFI